MNSDSELQRLLGGWISNPNVIQRINDLIAEEKEKSYEEGYAKAKDDALYRPRK